MFKHFGVKRQQSQSAGTGSVTFSCFKRFINMGKVLSRHQMHTRLANHPIRHQNDLDTTATNRSSLIDISAMKEKQIREKFKAAIRILTTFRQPEKESDSLNNVLDDLPVYLWMHDENHRIVYENSGVTKEIGTCRKQRCYQCLMGATGVCPCCKSKKVLKNKVMEQCTFCKRRYSGYDISIFHIPIINKEGQQFILTSSLHIKDPGVLSEALTPRHAIELTKKQSIVKSVKGSRPYGAP